MSRTASFYAGLLIYPVPFNSQACFKFLLFPRKHKGCEENSNIRNERMMNAVRTLKAEGNGIRAWGRLKRVETSL